MTMTPYDQRPTDDTPTIHAWDLTGPNMGDGAWREVTDSAPEVWVAPAGVAAPPPERWTIDDGYMHDPALPPPDPRLSPVPDLAIALDRGVADPLDIDAAVFDPL